MGRRGASALQPSGLDLSDTLATEQLCARTGCRSPWKISLLICEIVCVVFGGRRDGGSSDASVEASRGIDETDRVSPAPGTGSLTCSAEVRRGCAHETVAVLWPVCGGFTKILLYSGKPTSRNNVATCSEEYHCVTNSQDCRRGPPSRQAGSWAFDQYKAE